MRLIAIIAALIAASTAVDIPRLGATITACINSNCRCTKTPSGCEQCIYDNCDSEWDDDEETLFKWWCRNKSTKGCMISPFFDYDYAIYEDQVISIGVAA